jgi:hypothetical protein
MSKEGLFVAPIGEEFDPHDKGTYRELLTHLKKGAILHVEFELHKNGNLSRLEDFKTLLSEIAVLSIREGLPLDIILTAPGPDYMESKSITLTLHKLSEYR